MAERVAGKIVERGSGEENDDSGELKMPHTGTHYRLSSPIYSQLRRMEQVVKEELKNLSLGLGGLLLPPLLLLMMMVLSRLCPV